MLQYNTCVQWVLIAAPFMTHKPLYQRVVTMKYSSSCVDLNVQLCAAMCSFMRLDHAVAINNVLCTVFGLLLTYRGKMYLIGCGTISCRKYLYLFFLFKMRQLIKRSFCTVTSVRVDFEGAFNGCPIFHVVPVTLAGLETVKDNNTGPRGFFYVSVESM